MQLTGNDVAYNGGTVFVVAAILVLLLIWFIKGVIEIRRKLEIYRQREAAIEEFHDESE